jgi:hypothetical protein
LTRATPRAKGGFPFQVNPDLTRVAPSANGGFTLQVNSQVAND